MRSSADNDAPEYDAPAQPAVRGGRKPAAGLLTLTRIDCAPFPDVEPREGVWWEFSRRNGAEIDEELGWGETVTGSFIVTNE